MAYAQNRFTAWSYTRYSDHKKCPLFAKLKHLDKVPEGEKSPAMIRGGEIAKKSEDFLKGKLRAVPAELKSFAEDYRWFKQQPNLFVEETWGFNNSWSPVAWNDWNNCWLRVKIDVGYHSLKANVIVIRDGKTGKFRERDKDGYMLQLELYAAGAIVMAPNAKMVDVALMYTDLGIQYPDTPHTYTAKEALALQKTWDKRVKPLFNDTKFPPRPGDYCQWCPYSKAKGGPCKF